jgi:hypothetical protein
MDKFIGYFENQDNLGSKCESNVNNSNVGISSSISGLNLLKLISKPTLNFEDKLENLDESDQRNNSSSISLLKPDIQEKKSKSHHLEFG